MGTNYYLKYDPCDRCGRSENELHIGKSSGGWCFSLATYPHAGIKELDDWRLVWGEGKNIIEDEYGNRFSPKEMEDIILNRTWHTGSLLRHEIDNRLCVGWGDGTYDLMVGDFS